MSAFITYQSSPIGILKITGSDDGVESILFTEAIAESQLADHPLAIECGVELKEYFDGERTDFTIPLTPKGTMFQQMVWNELVKIPFGIKRTYNDIANAVGSAKMIRAVGSANARNPIAIIIHVIALLVRMGR